MRRLTLCDFRCFTGNHTWDIAEGQGDRVVWIVNGPNGAGKSTICDAVRYLLDAKYQGDVNDISEGKTSLRVSAQMMGLEIEKILEPSEENGRRVAKSSYVVNGQPTLQLSDVIPSANHIGQNQLMHIRDPSEIDLPEPRTFAELSNGRCVVFENDVVFGRHKSCDVLVSSSCVSTRHCRLKRPRCPDNEWLVYDYDSTNGTRVNGKKLERQTMQGRRKVAPVKHGDVIIFGDMSMTFKDSHPRRDVSVIFRELLREPTDASMLDFFPANLSNTLTWDNDELVVTMDGFVSKRPMATFSTGERILIYLSLLLAQYQAHGTTMCIMDEVDAKLDPKRRMALRYFLKNHAYAPRYTMMVSHSLGRQPQDIQVAVL